MAFKIEKEFKVFSLNLFAVCGSGSGIRCRTILISGFGMMSKKLRSGSGIWYELIGYRIIFPRELRNKFLGQTFLNSWMWIRNLFDLGSGMEKFGSGINIPDLQHWLLFTVP
jgi:hypothetical protein